jgi:uncharacterized protein YybS (DUF2232 family)
VEKEVAVPTRTDARQEPAGRALLAAAFAALLYGLPLVQPFLFLLSVIAPFPLIVQRLRGTPGTALVATAAATALIAIVFSPGHALVFVLMRALPGLVLGEAMARGRGLRRATGWAVLVVALQSCLLLVFANKEISDSLLSVWDTMRSEKVVEQLKAAGFTPETVTAWVEGAGQWRAAMEILYPSVFLIAGALMVLANAWLLRTYLARRDPGWLEGGEFEGLRWPLGMAVAFVATGASVLSPVLRPAAYNLLLVLAFFFALQGLAVVAYYVHRLAAPPLLRLVVLGLVVLNPWASQILALAGLFDIFIDFRKWAEPPVEDN